MARLSSFHPMLVPHVGAFFHRFGTKFRMHRMVHQDIHRHSQSKPLIKNIFICSFRFPKIFVPFSVALWETGAKTGNPHRAQALQSSKSFLKFPILLLGRTGRDRFDILLGTVRLT